MSYQKTTGPLMANSHPGSYCGQDAYNDMFVTARAAQRERERESMDVRNAEIGQLHDEQQGVNDECEAVQIGNGSDCEEEIYECRRLTPAECGRLQGFPDGWCDDVPHTDSAEYKLWGNGIALPCLLQMFRSMKKVFEEGR